MEIRGYPPESFYLISEYSKDVYGLIDIFKYVKCQKLLRIMEINHQQVGWKTA